MSERLDKHKEKRKTRVAAVKKKLQVAAGKKDAKSSNTVFDGLELMITIVNRKKAEYYLDFIQSFEVNMQVTALAHGTADAKTMSLLGLTDNEKVVIFSVIQKKKIVPAMRAIEWKFKTIKDGNGIACTTPLDSVIGKLIYGFLSNNKEFAESK